MLEKSNMKYQQEKKDLDAAVSYKLSMTRLCPDI